MNESLRNLIDAIEDYMDALAEAAPNGRPNKKALYRAIRAARAAINRDDDSTAFVRETVTK